MLVTYDTWDPPFLKFSAYPKENRLFRLRSLVLQTGHQDRYTLLAPVGDKRSPFSKPLQGMHSLRMKPGGHIAWSITRFYSLSYVVAYWCWLEVHFFLYWVHYKRWAYFSGIDAELCLAITVIHYQSTWNWLFLCDEMFQRISTKLSAV